MRYQKSKKGQAAIEFLMTYGWMLLVVLIVGALIFSFVDFGSLLPNKLDLSNNLRGDPTGSMADSTTGKVSVVFKYVGAKKVSISIKDAEIIPEIGDWKCTGENITNLDTGKSTKDETKDITFLRSQEGMMIFDCGDSNLENNDVLTGTITIKVKDPKSKLEIPSTSSIRLQVT